MSKTIYHLQQLSNTQLIILCHNYNIDPHQASNLSRRQLERRLHVEIISERAKWLARDLMYGIQSESYLDSRSSWQPDDSTYDDEKYPRLPFSMWGYMAARAQDQQRISGGDEQKELEQIDQLAMCVEEEVHVEEEYTFYQYKTTYKLDPAPTCVPVAVVEPEREPEPEPEQEPIMHKTKQSEQEEFKSSESNTEYYSLSSSSSDDFVPAVNLKLLQKAERFSDFVCSTAKISKPSESDAELSTEQELCTINYLSPEDVLDMELSSTSTLVNKNSISSTSARRKRPAFWRYILESICCDDQGKLDMDKLRYTIFCCALVACTYAGVKMLQ